MANQISEQISVYQKQLLQTQQALLTCNNDEDRANLESLENDLKELISLESYENEDEDKNSDESSSSELSLKDNFEEDKKVEVFEITQDLQLTFCVFLGIVQTFNK